MQRRIFCDYFDVKFIGLEETMRYATPASAKSRGMLSKERGAAFLWRGTDGGEVEDGNGRTDLVVDINRIPKSIKSKLRPRALSWGQRCLTQRSGSTRAQSRLAGLVKLPAVGSDQIRSGNADGNLCITSPAADSITHMIAAGAKASSLARRRDHRRLKMLSW